MVDHGAVRAGYDPPVWDATVAEHELRRPDLADDFREYLRSIEINEKSSA